VQQEGDSYTLVFHEPLDAVAFCLQVCICAGLLYRGVVGGCSSGCFHR
jgi:hypothetical protein